MSFAFVTPVCVSADGWSPEVQGFWRVTRSTLQHEDEMEVRTDRELLFFVESKIILINSDEIGLPSAVMYETSDRAAGNPFPRHVRIPDLEVAKDGRETLGYTEHPLEMKLVKRKLPVKIELAMRFGNERIQYEAVRLKRNQGVRTLRRLLDSDFLCSPELRQLLENAGEKGDAPGTHLDDETKHDAVELAERGLW